MDGGDNPDTYSEGVILSSSSATLGEDGEAEYEFNIANSGTYDVAVRILFPFWIRIASIYPLME